MSWARYIYIGLIIAGYIVTLAKNGEPREPYNAGSATISFVISIGLLFAGGFFS